MDPNPENTPENLTINDQESIIELVLEKLLGYDNAITEYDDHDTDDQSKKTTVKIELIPFQIAYLAIPQTQQNAGRIKFPNHPTDLTMGISQRDIPPPEI